MIFQIEKMVTFLFILCVVIILPGCTTTCHKMKISHVEQDMWNADVIYRQCGSASGYSVAVYTDDEGAPGTGEGSKEVFKTHYQPTREIRDVTEENSPLIVEWRSDRSLEIHHKTRMSIEDDKSKPMVTKADTTYQGVNIKYNPEPVFWE